MCFHFPLLFFQAGKFPGSGPKERVPNNFTVIIGTLIRACMAQKISYPNGVSRIYPFFEYPGSYRRVVESRENLGEPGKFFPAASCV